MKKEVYHPSTIYLSGKITGLHKHVYEHNFRFTRWMLINDHRHKNVTVINPLDIKPFLFIKCWIFYLISDLWTIMFCDTVFMLNNWKDSRGARIEHRWGKFLRKRIMYQQEVKKYYLNGR